jgi:hypothetical protein
MMELLVHILVNALFIGIVFVGIAITALLLVYLFIGD